MDNKQRVQKQFGKHAAHYVTSEIHAKGKDLAVLLTLSEAKREDIVLDIATGGGHVANGFAQLVDQVVALDITENMLREAEAFIRGNGHTNVTFVKGDAEQLPFPDASFSIVTCRIAPHHFSDIAAFSAESYRVLQDNGKFLLIDNVAPEQDDLDIFYNTVEKKRDNSHYRAWKKSEWISLLERSGFTVQQLITFPKTFQFEKWCKQAGLLEKEKQELEQYMLQGDKQIEKHFHIEVQDGHISSFQGQAVLIQCRK